MIQYQPSARHRRLYSDLVLEALDLSPVLPRDAMFALVTADAGDKPYVYGTLPDLARRIHRDRGRDGLQLRAVHVRFKDGPRKAVQVMAMDAGGRTRLIGYAWISGRPWEALQAALDAEEASGGRWQGVA